MNWSSAHIQNYIFFSAMFVLTIQKLFPSIANTSNQHQRNKNQQTDTDASGEAA